MSSDYRNFQNPTSSMDSRQGKKNLRRDRRFESDTDFPVVFENDGFEGEGGEVKARSKENRRLDSSKTNKLRTEGAVQGTNNGTDSNWELREKDTNVRQSETDKNTSHVRFRDDSHKNQDSSTKKPAPVPPDDVNKELLGRVKLAKPSNAYDRWKSARPSLTADMVQRGFRSVVNEACDLPFSRSQSVRVASSRTAQKPRRRLLRELSLSDSDETVTKDYGSLGKVPLPRRQSESDLPTKSSLRILVTTMQELMDRGKVYQMIIIDLDSSTVLSILPKCEMSKSDVNGMVKSLTACSPTIFKLDVSGNVYTCFKHSTSAVQGRSEDVVMVMQKTITCLVVGFSQEDAPGACQSEVMEFAKVLERADW